MTPKEHLLHICCMQGNLKEIKKLFNSTSDTNLTFNDGVYFKIAIKKQNYKLLEELLNYYHKTRLPRDKVDTDEYKKALSWLDSTLEEAARMFELTPEIKAVLQPYHILHDTDEESVDSDQNLDGFDADDFKDLPDIAIAVDDHTDSMDI